MGKTINKEKQKKQLARQSDSDIEEDLNQHFDPQQLINDNLAILVPV